MDLLHTPHSPQAPRVTGPGPVWYQVLTFVCARDGDRNKNSQVKQKKFNSSDNIDSYMEIYNSLSPTVKSYVDNEFNEENTELNDYREVIDYSFMKKPDVTPSYSGLYVLFGVEFVALLIIFILFSLFIF